MVDAIPCHISLPLAPIGAKQYVFPFGVPARIFVCPRPPPGLEMCTLGSPEFHVGAKSRGPPTMHSSSSTAAGSETPNTSASTNDDNLSRKWSLQHDPDFQVSSENLSLWGSRDGTFADSMKFHNDVCMDDWLMVNGVMLGDDTVVDASYSDEHWTEIWMEWEEYIDGSDWWEMFSWMQASSEDEWVWWCELLDARQPHRSRL